MPLDIYWIVTGKAGKTFMLNFKTMEEKMMDYILDIYKNKVSS